jgi:16S rRNA (uracil1498-N3)-methyltransferase
MHRFFIERHMLRRAQRLSLPEQTAHQVRDVLHLVVGERLVLLDNSGDEFVCAVADVERKLVEVEVLERRAGKAESPVKITLCQGLLKSARFEWVLEKGTELGVTTFVPTLCRRSLAGLEAVGSTKVQRWQRIVQEAAEQCGRSRIPTLMPTRPLMHALNDYPVDAIAIMPWENEQHVQLRDILCAAKQTRKPGEPINVVLFIGPEGGLMEEEVMLAQRRGVQIVSLGTRILRAETAALTAVANVMYELE